MPRTEVRGGQILDSTVDLVVDTTGVLPASKGGTGNPTNPLNNVLLGNGTGALQAVVGIANGHVLTWNGTTWTSAVAAGGGGSGITRSIVTVTTAVTGAAVALVDYVYFLNTGAVYTQPTAVGNTNGYTIKNITLANMTVTSTSAQTFDGGTLVLGIDQSVTLISDNTNWRII